jgi:hypothetical protein
MKTKAPPVFKYCYACKYYVVKSTVEDHHYPVPDRHGGLHTVPLCRTCHDLVDRITLDHWPRAAASEGIMEVLGYAPSLVAIWASTSLTPDAPGP